MARNKIQHKIVVNHNFTIGNGGSSHKGYKMSYLQYQILKPTTNKQRNKHIMERAFNHAQKIRPKIKIEGKKRRPLLVVGEILKVQPWWVSNPRELLGIFFVLFLERERERERGLYFDLVLRLGI